MTKIGRNQPCPCGSGKKYKRCCGDPRSRPDAEPEGNGYPCLTRDIPGAEAGPLALDWLFEHHESAALAAFGQYFASLDGPEMAAILSTPSMMTPMIDCNGKELLLAEGVLQMGDAEVSCVDFVTGPQGPALTDQQREYLRLMGSRPMSLYQVVESRPGTGFHLRDLIDPEEPVRFVAEAVLAGRLMGGEGNHFGARLIPGEPWRLSGATYPYGKEQADQMAELIRRELATGPEPILAREIRGTFISHGWLDSLARTPPGVFEEVTTGLLPRWYDLSTSEEEPN